MSRVAAVIPTRGDQPLDEILLSIPEEWEIVLWDNSVRQDLAVYGRYAAIELTDAPIIYTQDDDCVLEQDSFVTLRNAYQPGVLTANMPERFRHDFYREHCLVGFGAIFDRDLPHQAFMRYWRGHGVKIARTWPPDDPFWLRHCDVVFTTLTTRHLVDVAHRDLPWASNPERMWKQKDHQTSRSLMLAKALAAR